MERYVAFLRGVSPMNCRMPELRRAFEAAGFEEVRTLLSSGNVAFSAPPEIVPVLEQKAEAAMDRHLGKAFRTIVRPSWYLQQLVARSPFSAYRLPADAKPIVTFLRTPYEGSLRLPIEHGQAVILELARTEVYSAYVPDAKGPVFMTLLEKTFGKEITTRTLDTVRRCAAA